MFEFDYTAAGIAAFNQVKDNAETRACVVGTLVGEHVMDDFYNDRISWLLDEFDADFYDNYIIGVGCLRARGMSGDNCYGVCEDKDVRCIRFHRIKRNGEMPYGHEGRVFKKKAGEFLREIISDCGMELSDNQRDYLCTRFAVEWMEARICQFGEEAVHEPINAGLLSDAALDALSCPSVLGTEASSHIAAELMVIRGGSMPTGIATGGTTTIQQDERILRIIDLLNECHNYISDDLEILMDTDEREWAVELTGKINKMINELL